MKNLILTLIILALACSGSIAQSVGINSNGSAPNGSAMLDVSSTSKGLLLPCMTTAQRNAIASPALGLLIFNITTNCFEAYVNGAWNSVSCPSACTPPASCTASSASGIGCTTFTANWSSSSGASSYFLDVATNSGFTALVPAYLNLNIGNTTSYNVSGLTAGTIYYYRVRAATACVSGNSNTISLTTNALPAQPGTITGTAAVCQGASGVAYSVTNVSGITYTWTYSGTGLTLASGSGTNAITANFSASATSGTLTVTPSNSCGTGTAQTFAITLSGLPAQPTAASHTATYTQIVWNWSTASGATGYKWNTTNNYGSATDMGTATSKTEGLSYNTSYTRFVWAYNASGCFSAYTTLTQTTLASPFAIGQSYGGGKIFYIDATYEHGLIAATSDQSTGIKWAQCVLSCDLIGTLTTIGSGSANTDKIIVKYGAGTTYAAGLARAYTGGGYSDWYLPSYDELEQLYQKQNNIGGFPAWGTLGYYWSSSEQGSNDAYRIQFAGTDHSSSNKGDTWYVRAIRSF